MDSYKGFSLFNDLDDKNDQTFNRARMLVNITTDNESRGKFNMKASVLSMGYIKQIPVEDRHAVLVAFVALMAKEGFVIPEDDAVKADKAIAEAVAV